MIHGLVACDFVGILFIGFMYFFFFFVDVRLVVCWGWGWINRICMGEINYL